MDRTNTRLKDIELPLLQETATDDLIEDFYTPCLQVATEYKRAVGYFTSSWFEVAATGMAGLADNGGTAKWIISPKLATDDWEAIKRGEAAQRDRELYSQMDSLVGDLHTNLKENTQNTLAWLIADGLLQIKIAVAQDPLGGDFHDKWGIIIDEFGDKIAFHGSQNDSRKSLTNYEANSIFTSWRSELDETRVQQHEQRFDDLWDNKKSGVQCFSLPDSVNLDIVELRSDERPYQDPGEKTKLTSPYRWRHQEEAVTAFIEAEAGILEMATGTGKTRTSLKVLDQLLRDDEIENLVVATHGNDLLNQWKNTILEHFSPHEMFLYCQYGGEKKLGNYLASNNNRLEVLLTSYANLGDAIEGDTKDKLADSLLICDEVHNMGAEAKQEQLGGKLDVFPYRLGLSATPFDPYDPDRNEFLKNEVGPVVYEFGLESAIRRGILCEFDYTPLTYELSDDDKKAQKEAFSKFAGLKRQNPSIPQSQLYIMLSRVRKESHQKLPILREYLSDNPNILDSCIIFVETKDFGHEVQQIIFDYVDDFHTYYGEDDESNLEAFSHGTLSTLVTSRAISEGIDIQSVKNIILCTAPRSRGTTIQRIGRALRKDPSNPNKKANIVDFVVGSDINREIIEDADDEDQSMTPPDKDRYEWLRELNTVTQLE
ncbi:DEAD/DEAH box helicase family protein [Haloarcula sp. S1AR25-5A]|uniref:DEAD/DEAH box helicase family protein n=1 Tax=Haloarcula terrestris TaxID=2950533 RepID=A0AAE4F0B3_9EURY|nr:DEAD/DEAH box helicase family protein [Haloarcula terrestris]MDS0223466.1 DEAD/DEAH box helicase family protein [Haloarcula terrestris]